MLETTLNRNVLWEEEVDGGGGGGGKKEREALL